ncbi:extracellular solute-binding protein [Treponema sp.]|uniref:extracellular solute-binding protein n=1 Tax=Treponema sp. TaxID=166 RepID=UPI003EFCBD89
MNLGNRRIFPLAAALLLFTLTSCRKQQSKPLVIWSDNAEIVSYVELFNATHKNISAFVVYKDGVARSLPPAKDELTPDLLIGPWLKNSATRKYFQPVDYLFREKSLDRSLFYKQLLEYGQINEKQYLVPLSFNLPAMIFNKKNEDLITTEHFLNLEQIRDFSAEFNEKNKSGAFTAMGYAPSWDSEFMYLATRLYGTSYHEKGSSFIWNEEAMQNSIQQMRQWTLENNSSTSAEQNFQFRYLYMPGYKQVASGRCLFSYTTSDKLFTLTDSQITDLSFRWLEQDGKIPVEDWILTIGLYKKAEHPAQAEKFIAWLMKIETQQLLIERTENMKLDTVNFGIAGGFSSLKEVNEKLYPAYYRHLLGNMPPEQFITLPNILPYRWHSLKSHVIIPYLKESIRTENSDTVQPLEERIAEWTKQFY